MTPKSHDFLVNSSTVVTIKFLNTKTKKYTSKKYRCVVKPEEKQVDAIVSAVQTGVKTVTVTTNFDATNSTISLTKGTSAVEEKHTISADGKTITFNTTASIVAATYTVKVGDLSKEFDGEVSKASKIVFLSDKAALRKLTPNATIYQGASVGYRVENQFEDDITKGVSLNATASCDVSLSPSKNMIYFSTQSTNGFMLGRDLITVSLLDPTTGLNETATLTVSAEAYASDIKFEGVYNVDGKELTEDTTFENDSFYALFTAKDQYGNKFNNYKDVHDGTNLFLTVIGGLTGLDKARNSDFITIQKDGVDYLAYALGWSGSITPSAGTANLQVLSSGGGSCNGEIVVGQGGRVDTITVTQNEVIVVGEENEISFTALDASGKEVTAYKQLKDIEITGGAAGYSLRFMRKDDGSAKLVLDATSATVTRNNPAMISYAFKTENNKFSNVLLKVSENARPVAIDGLRGVDTTISNKLTKVTVKVKNLVIEDQYGRVVPEGKVAAMMNASGSGIYNLAKINLKLNDVSVIKVTTSAAVSTSGIVTNGGLNVSTCAINTVTKDTVLFEINPASATATGTKALTLQIYNNATRTEDRLADATVDVNFIVRDTTAVSVAKAEVSPVYVVTGAGSVAKDLFSQNVKVKVGTTLLAASDYTVSVPGGMGVTGGAIDGTPVWAVYATDTQGDIDEFKNKTATTVTRTITITLNGSGEKFTQDVTLDCTAPKITSVVDLTGKIAPVSGCVISGGSLFNNAPTGIQAKVALSYASITDQYGKAVTDHHDGTFTLMDGRTVTPSYNFVCTVPYGSAEGGAPKALTSNNKSDASMTVETGFKGATLYIDFGGKTSTVIIDSIGY